MSQTETHLIYINTIKNVIRDNPKITAKRIKELTGINRRSIYSTIRYMKNNDMLLFGRSLKDSRSDVYKLKEICHEQ